MHPVMELVESFAKNSPTASVTLLVTNQHMLGKPPTLCGFFGLWLSALHMQVSIPPCIKMNRLFMKRLFTAQDLQNTSSQIIFMAENSSWGFESLTQTSQRKT